MKPIPSLRFEPFAITAIGASQILDDLQRATATFKASDLTDDAISASSILEVVGNVAVISISGPLLKEENWLSWIYGYATYDQIWSALEIATADKNVRGILLKIDSPGGVTNGLGELADFVNEIAARMLVWVYVDGVMASAAYWIGSQANHIVSYQTSESGCVGTRMTLVDDSGFMKLHGFVVLDLVNDQSPDKRSYPIDKGVIERIEKRLTDNSAVFISTVARGRQVDEETVIEDFGKGDVLIAKRALAVGMIDEIGNFNSALAGLTAACTSTGPQRPQRGAIMKDPKIAAAQSAGPTASDKGDEWQCAGCNEMMGSSAKAFCSKCSDDDGDEGDEDEGENSKALATAGLLGKKRGETKSKMLAFVQSIMEATGTKTASAAIVKAIENAGAAVKLEAFKVESEAKAASARVKSVGDKLIAAIGTGKVALGTLTKELPLLQGAPKAAMRKALEALTKQDATEIVGAITGASVSEEFAASVDEWIDSKGASALPSAQRQPGEGDRSALANTSPPALGADGHPVSNLSIDAVIKAAAEKAAANKGAR